ncbi:MAG TPA: DUF6452 family protein [Bacteroidales bacterium]|nr:DUF6452 family protein [Bacteroidales bacterium]
MIRKIFGPGKLTALITIGLILFCYSCTPGSCYDETEAKIKASFFMSDNSANEAPDSVTIFGINTDSLLYNKSTGIRQALLPLDPSTESCTFVIRINGINDTVTFQYNPYTHFLSKECGYTYYYDLGQPVTTGNIINRITITKNIITTQSEENIRIYY